MTNIIKIKRGLEENLSNSGTNEGELKYTRDANKLYIYSNGTNKIINDKKYNSTTKYSKDDLIEIFDTEENKLKLFYSKINNNINHNPLNDIEENYWNEFKSSDIAKQEMIPGSIVASTIILNYANLVLAEGQLFYKNGIYKDFIEYMKNLFYKTFFYSFSYNDIYKIYTKTLNIETGTPFYNLDGTIYKDFLYCSSYNDGTSIHRIYTKDAIIKADTILYDINGNVYTGSDFVITEISGRYIIQYQGDDTQLDLDYSKGYHYIETTQIFPVYYDGNGSHYILTADGTTAQLNNCFTTETDYQNQINTYGECGKYVFDLTNETLRIPTIRNYLKNGDIDSIGNIVDEELPNIKGILSSTFKPDETKIREGAFKNSQYINYFVIASGGGASNYAVVKEIMDASTGQVKSDGTYETNSTYKNGGKVRPQSINVLYYIVVGNVIKTDIEIDIDNIETELDNLTIELNKNKVIEEYGDEINGYCIYTENSRRRCRQWGFVPLDQSTTGDQTITLYKAYNNLYYWADYMITYFNDTNNATYKQIKSKTTTSFTIRKIASANIKASFQWFTDGYIN